MLRRERTRIETWLDEMELPRLLALAVLLEGRSLAQSARRLASQLRRLEEY